MESAHICAPRRRNAPHAFRAHAHCTKTRLAIPPPPSRTQLEKASPSRLHAFDKLEAEIPEANLAMYKATYSEVVSELLGMLTTRSPYIRPEKSRSTVMTGLREIRDLEGTHRFYRFLLSKLMCNGHLLNVSIPKSGKSDVGFSRSGFL